MRKLAAALLLLLTACASVQNPPDDFEDRPRYETLFREMAPKIASLQGDDGYLALQSPRSRHAPSPRDTLDFLPSLVPYLQDGIPDGRKVFGTCAEVKI